MLFLRLIDWSVISRPLIGLSWKTFVALWKFESPDYGLKEASIAYNMSMDDEVSNIINGLSEPENQILMNNQNASGNVDNQLEYSAIKVKGNPLKSGTYISPYSV